MSHTLDNAERARRHRISCLSDSYDVDPNLRKHCRSEKIKIGEEEPVYDVEHCTLISGPEINSLADSSKTV